MQLQWLRLITGGGSSYLLGLNTKAVERCDLFARLIYCKAYQFVQTKR